MTLLAQLTQTLQTVCATTWPMVTDFKPEIKRPTQAGVADFTTTVAMELFGQLPAEVRANFNSPLALASELVTKLQTALPAELATTVTLTTAKPGFINLQLSPAYYFQQLSQLAQTDTLVTQAPELHQYVVEFSSPNIAKPFTVGHLRSTIIGHSLANLLTATGHTVYRDNHVGDWGTQFGKQIYAIKTWGDEAALEQSPNPTKDLVELYIKFHQEAEADPSLEDEGRAWFQRLETGDPEARRLWQKCIDWSWKKFDEIYAKLNVTFTENGGRGYGESYFETHMPAVVAELKAKNLLTESEGAELVFFPEDRFPPLMIVKKDGATLYATRDLATDKFRFQHYGPDVIIINEVGAEQQLYFQQLFAVEAMLGWTKPGQRHHFKHGLIRFKTGKMSTRKGNVIWLEEVLQEAFDRTKTIAGERLADDQLWQIAIGAIKWNDLKRNSEQPIAFDWDEVLRLEGNSGPYLQYAYTRCVSVLAQAPTHEVNLSEVTQWPAEATETDLALLKKLLQYDETIRRSAELLAPHLLCTYLFELAQTFSSWYANHSVLKAATPELGQVRLQLTQLVARILKAGLELLGITVLQKM